MNEFELVDNIINLIYKYVPSREDLIDMIKSDIDCTKYILSEIDKYKIMNYSDEDLELLKEVSFYYL